MRARALSTLAGFNRVGKFVGPFAGAAAMTRLGTDGAYWVHLAVAVVAAGALLLLRDVTPPAGQESAPASAADNQPTGQVQLLRTLGVAVFFVGAMRASRQAVIPLWAAHLGLSATTTSLLYGLGAALEMTMFYPGGTMMDRLGRRWVAGPSMLTLGLAHTLLPLANGAVGVGAISVLMGVGNGISSGIVMTLGADIAPATGRAQFLGTWRLFSDAGNGSGPVVTSALVAAASLTVAVLAVGVLGFVTAAALYRWIPRTPKPLPVATSAVSS
jgi:MFS family permease